MRASGRAGNREAALTRHTCAPAPTAPRAWARWRPDVRRPRRRRPPCFRLLAPALARSAAAGPRAARRPQSRFQGGSALPALLPAAGLRQVTDRSVTSGTRHEPKSKKRSLLTLVPDDAEDTAFQIYFAGKRAGRRRRGGGVAARADPAGRVGARVTAAAWLSRARASPSRGSLPSPSSAPGLGHVARGAARDSARQRRVRRLRGRVPRGAHTCRHRGASGRGCPHWPP